QDVAAFAVLALNRPAARTAIVELRGPEPLSQLEMVALFEELTGRRFERLFVSEGDLQARGTAARNPVELTFAGLMLAAARGDKIDMIETMRRFSFQPKTLREYAAIAAGTKS